MMERKKKKKKEKAERDENSPRDQGSSMHQGHNSMLCYQQILLLLLQFIDATSQVKHAGVLVSCLSLVLATCARAPPRE